MEWAPLPTDAMTPASLAGFAPTQGPATPRRKLLVAASGEKLEALGSAAPLAALGELVLIALGAGEPVSEDALNAADLLVLEVDPADQASLVRIGEVRKHHPALMLIAALRNADAAAVRALVHHDITDFARLPFDPEELAGQVATALSQLSRPAIGRTLAPMMVLAGSRGGSGVTTVLTHLAAALGEQPNHPRVCLVDLDLQGGQAAFYLGQEARVTVSALLEAGDRLDPELLRGAITDSGHGFAVLAAPTAITPLDQVDDSRLLALLQLVRREFDMVLVDLPTDWTNWSLSLVAAASRVILLATPSVASLRQAKRRLELFDTIGIDRTRVAVVLNRAKQKLFHAISTADVAEVLQFPVLATIADEGDALTAAQNEGRLLTDIHRHARFAKNVAALADLLTSQQGDKP